MSLQIFLLSTLSIKGLWPKKGNKMKLSSYEACEIIEGFDGEQHTDKEIIAAFQSLINSGAVWKLQGFYGRTAAQLIEDGVCKHAKKDRSDFWGNKVKQTIKIKEQQNIGKAKYVVNYCTGKKHDDGSDFYDIEIFKNKVKKDKFINSLKNLCVK